MSSDREADIIKNIINQNSEFKSKITGLSQKDIENKIKNVDKNAAIKKLKSMGLDSVAQKMKSVSDEELIGILSKNPALLKKINNFLK